MTDAVTTTNTEVQVPDNILWPNPAKDYKALFTWLKANTCQDPARTSINAIWLDDNRTYWATNGYSVVRAEMYEDQDNPLPPGHWFINECTSKLIHFIKADVRFPDVHTIWDGEFSLKSSSMLVFDPAIFATITKPFGRVIMVSKTERTPMRMVLDDPKSLPFGCYGAIQMPVLIQEIEFKFKRAGFKLEYEMPDTFKFYSDPGHAWVAVPMEAVTKLGIQDEISAYSYLHNNIAYLEEDMDAQIFENVYEQKMGRGKPLYDRVPGESTFIREYPGYPSKRQQFVPLQQPVEPEPIKEDLYLKAGFASRDDYLESLADTYGVEVLKVHMMADALGEYEDFDGLISELEDLN